MGEETAAPNVNETRALARVVYFSTLRATMNAENPQQIVYWKKSAPTSVIILHLNKSQKEEEIRKGKHKIKPKKLQKLYLNLKNNMVYRMGLWLKTQSPTQCQ